MMPLPGAATLHGASDRRGIERDLARCRQQLAEAQHLARSGESLFERGFDQSAVAAILSDLDGLPYRVNEAMCALMGRTSEELIGRDGAAFLHPDDLSHRRDAMARVSAGKNIRGDERRYLRPDGSIVWVSVHATLVRDELGEPLYWIGELHDLTDRKRLEREKDDFVEELRSMNLEVEHAAEECRRQLRRQELLANLGLAALNGNTAVLEGAAKLVVEELGTQM